MNLIESHLNEAIMFVNDNLRERKSENDRDKLVHILSEDVLILDEISVCLLPNNLNKKDLIIAIQNVLDQLDNLFEEKKYPILLTNICKRNCYLPENKDSLYALNNIFVTH